MLSMILNFFLLFIISLFSVNLLIDEVINFYLNLTFLSNAGYQWVIKVDYDFISVSVLVMLLICFCYVWLYTYHYFGGVNTVSNSLNKIIFIFVAVMASLVSTGDFLTTLIFWEYLGVVSFFLILFYDSYLSLRSSIVTLVSSRFGDVALFIIILMASFLNNANLWGTLLILLVVLTKSASFPFTSWLLEAMRAPTPVSSLVHSSTLVAAGVWFSMRYDFLLFFNNIIGVSILLISTIFITGLCCFYFLDLKKIVALSTCNNISWCIFYLVFGDVILSLFQLVTHGVSKCVLFMLVGDVMSGTSGSQASNCVYNTLFFNKWNIFSLLCVIIGLSGVPFLGVFFTKHFLLTNFCSVNNILLTLSVLICVFLSYFYSFRFCSLLLNNKSSYVLGVAYFFNTSLMCYFWLFINFFISLLLDEVNSLNTQFSFFLIGFQVVSCCTAVFFYNSQFASNWSSSLFGSDNLVECLYSVFFNLLSKTSLFFHRWDNYNLSKFNKSGVSSLNIFNNVILNFFMFGLIIFLMCWIIV